MGNKLFAEYNQTLYQGTDSMSSIRFDPTNPFETMAPPWYSPEQTLPFTATPLDSHQNEAVKRTYALGNHSFQECVSSEPPSKKSKTEANQFFNYSEIACQKAGIDFTNLTKKCDATQFEKKDQQTTKEVLPQHPAIVRQIRNYLKSQMYDAVIQLSEAILPYCLLEETRREINEEMETAKQIKSLSKQAEETGDIRLKLEICNLYLAHFPRCTKMWAERAKILHQYKQQQIVELCRNKEKAIACAKSYPTNQEADVLISREQEVFAAIPPYSMPQSKGEERGDFFPELPLPPLFEFELPSE
jgi:hypothetical protein